MWEMWGYDIYKTNMTKQTLVDYARIIADNVRRNDEKHVIDRLKEIYHLGRIDMKEEMRELIDKD